MPGSTAQTNKHHTFYLQQRPENGFTWADIKVNHPLDYENIKEYNLTIRVEVRFFVCSFRFVKSLAPDWRMNRFKTKTILTSILCEFSPEVSIALWRKWFLSKQDRPLPKNKKKRFVIYLFAAQQFRDRIPMRYKAKHFILLGDQDLVTSNILGGL